MTQRRRLALAAIAVGALVLAACGGSSGRGQRSASGARTVTLEMRDIAYSPTTVDVKKGER